MGLVAPATLSGLISYAISISRPLPAAAFARRAPNSPDDANIAAANAPAAMVNPDQLLFLFQFIQRLVYEVPLFRIAIIDYRFFCRDPLRYSNNRRLRRIGNPERARNLLQLHEQLLGQFQLNCSSRHCQQSSPVGLPGPLA